MAAEERIESAGFQSIFAAMDSSKAIALDVNGVGNGDSNIWRRLFLGSGVAVSSG
jgi:hypothetical protein